MNVVKVCKILEAKVAGGENFKDLLLPRGFRVSRHIPGWAFSAALLGPLAPGKILFLACLDGRVTDCGDAGAWARYLTATGDVSRAVLRQCSASIPALKISEASARRRC